MSGSWCCAVFGVLLGACACSWWDSPSGDCPDGKRCDSSRPRGTVHGKRADGTVDVTIEQAWPDRPEEPPPLAPLEIAQACVSLAACNDFEPGDGLDIEGTRRIALALCAQPLPDARPGAGPGSYFWEERAVPNDEQNERWTFAAREIIDQRGNCVGVRAVATARAKEIRCEEAGCWWSSPSQPIPSVSCNGDVATLRTAGRSLQRDCARSLTRCDEASPTGCSDRAPVACESPAADRCVNDSGGAFRLGCDGNGRVSLRDCSRIRGGTCGQTADGLACIYPDAGECGRGAATCAGASLEICVLGAISVVDCVALGFGACKNGLCPAL